MSASLIRLNEADARQWLRLRQLRVQRAREALAAARQAERRAQDAVAAREHQIDATRQALQTLAQRWGGASDGSNAGDARAADLARWAQQVIWHRAALDERLERDEYELIDEQADLAAAQAQVRSCHAALARAQSRESAVEATLSDRRQRLQRQGEQQAELDAEEAAGVRA